MDQGVYPDLLGPHAVPLAVAEGFGNSKLPLLPVDSWGDTLDNAHESDFLADDGHLCGDGVLSDSAPLPCTGALHGSHKYGSWELHIYVLYDDRMHDQGDVGRSQMDTPFSFVLGVDEHWSLESLAPVALQTSLLREN